MKPAIAVTDRGVGIINLPEEPPVNDPNDDTIKPYIPQATWEIMWEKYEAAKTKAFEEIKLFEDQEAAKEELFYISTGGPKVDVPFSTLFPVGSTYAIPPDFPKYVEVMVPKRVWFVEHKETREWLCSSLDGLFTNDPLKAYFYDSEAEAGLVIEVRKLYFSMPTEHEFDITVLRFVDKQEQTPSKESSMNDAEVLREYAKHQTVLVIKENLNRIADRLDSLQSKLKDRDELLEEMVGYIRTTKTDTKTALTGMKILTRYSNLKAK